MAHDVFISYSRKDKGFATRLVKALLNYVPPKEMNLPQRHLEVFLDAEDFTGSEYYQSLDRHLADSAKLILLCSPAARGSQYVNDEIRRFARMKGAEHIIPLMVAGLPNNEAGPAQADQMAFPEALCELMAMPLAADYRSADEASPRVDRGRFEASWYTTLANIYGISRAEIEQRDRKRRLRRQRITGATVTGVSATLVVLAILYWGQKQDTREQAKVAAARFLAGQAVKAAELPPARGLRIGGLLAAESLRTAWTDAGYAQWHAAVRRMPYTLAQIKTDAVTIALAFTPDAQRLVVLCGERHVHVYALPDLRPLQEIQADQTAFALAVSHSGNHAIAYQQGGAAIEIVDLDRGAVTPVPLPDDLDVATFDAIGNPVVASRHGIWRIDAADGTVQPRLEFSSPAQRIALAPDATTAVTITEAGLVAFAVKNGSQLWQVPHAAENRYDEIQFSSNGTRLIVMSANRLTTLDAANGATLGSMLVERQSPALRTVAARDAYLLGTRLYPVSGAGPLDVPIAAKQGENFQQLPALSPSGRHIAAFTQTNPETFSIIDTALSEDVAWSESALHVTLDEGQSVNAATFSADGRLLAVASREPGLGGGKRDSTIQLLALDREPWRPIVPANRWTFPSAYAVLPNDARVVVVDGSDGALKVYDAAGVLLWQREEKRAGSTLVVSPGGRFLARSL